MVNVLESTLEWTYVGEDLVDSGIGSHTACFSLDPDTIRLLWGGGGRGVGKVGEKVEGNSSQEGSKIPT
jgi:hypothetical protein